jgi:hypothetical protein
MGKRIHFSFLTSKLQLRVTLASSATGAIAQEAGDWVSIVTVTTNMVCFIHLRRILLYVGVTRVVKNGLMTSLLYSLYVNFQVSKTLPLLVAEIIFSCTEHTDVAKHSDVRYCKVRHLTTAQCTQCAISVYYSVIFSDYPLRKYTYDTLSPNHRHVL